MNKKIIFWIAIGIILVAAIVTGLLISLNKKQWEKHVCKNHLEAKDEFDACKRIGGEVFCVNGPCFCSCPGE